MSNNVIDKEVFKNRVKEVVKTLYRTTLKEATKQQLFQAVSYVTKDTIVDNWLATQKQIEEDDPKMLYYMSMEFLMGRALGNSLINLTAYKDVKEARMRLWATAVLAVWQPASWIRWLPWVMLPMAAVSATVTACSNRKLRMVIR